MLTHACKHGSLSTARFLSLFNLLELKQIFIARRLKILESGPNFEGEHSTLNENLIKDHERMKTFFNIQANEREKELLAKLAVEAKAA